MYVWQVVAIAHRLSTIQDCDFILFLGEDGRIQESGSFDELNSLEGGKFREFVVYDNTLAYPEFLVQFERWEGGRKVS